MIPLPVVPTIETERLRLRGWQRADFEAVHAYKSDPEVMTYTGGAETPSQAWKSFCAMAGSWIINGFGYFCIADKESDLCVGHCGLIQLPDWEDPEVGYTLSRAAWGKGYATEAVISALSHVYRNLNWETAVSHIDPNNVSSQKVAERAGATLETKNADLGSYTADIWRHLPPEEFMERFQ